MKASPPGLRERGERRKENGRAWKEQEKGGGREGEVSTEVINCGKGGRRKAARGGFGAAAADGLPVYYKSNERRLLHS